MDNQREIIKETFKKQILSGVVELEVNKMNNHEILLLIEVLFEVIKERI